MIRRLFFVLLDDSKTGNLTVLLNVVLLQTLDPFEVVRERASRVCISVESESQRF